jgi:hypothetical protein
MSHAGDPTALTTGEPAHAAPAAPTDSAPAAQAAPAVADDTDDNRGNLVAADAPDDNVGNTVAAAPKPADDEEDGPAPGNEHRPRPRRAAPCAAGEMRRAARSASGRRARAPRAPAPREGGERGERRGQGHKGAAPRCPQHRAFKVGDKVRAKIVGRAGGVMCDLWGKEKGVLDLPRARRGHGRAAGGRRRRRGGAAGRLRGGNLVVTRDPSRAERGRRSSSQAFNAGEPIEALVTGFNKGGLELDIERRAGLLPELAGRRSYAPTRPSSRPSCCAASPSR